MKVLVACEESQAVTKAFRARGHEAYSCDLLPCSGGHPEWHIQGDCLAVLNDGWGLIIAHPPCTYLSRAGSFYLYHPADKHLPVEARREHPDHPGRRAKQVEAVEFALKIWYADCPRVCIENPTGALCRAMKPDQVIEPFMFGHPYTKPTALWLKGLPPLHATDQVEPLPAVKIGNHGKTYGAWWAHTMTYPLKERARIRSKTFNGIAQAMADQWGGALD